MTTDAGELAAATLTDGRALAVRLAQPADAEALLALIHRAFRARPVVGEEPEALRDDLASVRDRLEHGSGYVAVVDGAPAGVIMVAPMGTHLRLGRVCVLPEHRRAGLASFLVGVVLEHQAAMGQESVQLLARREFPELQAWWARHGFVPVGEERNCIVMQRAIPVVAEVPDADAMRALGRRLARVLRAGDLVIASGDLGAGKTTLAQGLGVGLEVSGPIISPTFVLSRVHPSTVGGPAFVHVDAYRLGSFAELEDMDLEASLDEAVTLVEWGTGIAEGLASDRLDVDIRRGMDPADETRWVFLTPIGPRWSRDAIATAAKEDA
ncbi:MAG: tRNA (adenosine(37)-N6)-threonylcarbamoyltransferase complex ATPase subunit type 1 TsaE [Actinomycetes bacterium]